MFTTKEKRNQFLLVLTISLLGWFLPWFSFNPQETGYVWGLQLVGYAVLPVAIVYWLCMDHRQKGSGGWSALMMALLLLVPLLYLWQLGSWHTLCITGAFDLSTGFRTARWGYWLALCLSCLPPAAFAVLKKQAQ